MIRNRATNYLPPPSPWISLPPDIHFKRVHDYWKQTRSLFSPDHLGALHKDAPPGNSKSNSRAAGWTDHIEIRWKECDTAPAI